MNKKQLLTITIALMALALFITPKSFAETDLSGIDIGIYKYKFETFDNEIKKNPDNILPYLQKGELLLIFNQQEKAKDIYKKALELAKNEPQKAYIDAMILYGDGEYDKAKEILSTLIKDNPKNERALYTLGLIELKNKDTNKALGHFQKAITLNINFVEAINQIGWLYLNNADYDKAIKYFNQALYRDPYHISALDGKGYALYKLELYKEALPYIQKVIILVPDSWGSWATLGEIYYSDGKLILAKYCLDRAKAIYPEALEVQILEQKLQPIPSYTKSNKKEDKNPPK